MCRDLKTSDAIVDSCLHQSPALQSLCSPVSRQYTRSTFTEHIATCSPYSSALKCRQGAEAWEPRVCSFAICGAAIEYQKLYCVDTSQHQQT